MSDAKSFVDAKIAGKKVVMFSKPSCPFCRNAKAVFDRYIASNELSKDDYEVIEIDSLSNCSQIQDYLQKLTGARSVPRVFINGKFVGGGDDIVAKDKNGELKKLLS